MKKSTSDFRRRGFIQGVAAGAAFSGVSTFAAKKDKKKKDKSKEKKPKAGLPANERLNLACIGVGGRGGSIVKSMHAEGLANVVALCDVNMGGKETAAIEKMFPDVPRFKDFRQLFDKMANQIDAVTIAVPDFSHFPIAMMAMGLGKHVYVEKPLTRTFHEAELMMAMAKKSGVVTQMGNQGHSGMNYYQFKAWTEAGIIKDVTHVDAYMNKGRRWHPYGVVTGYPEAEPIPASLDWDLWHTTTAKFHEFNSKYHPGNWRGWHDFGTGCFGDWGAHILDTIHQFLELGLPQTIEATKMVGRSDYIFPMESTIKFSFPARGSMPAMDIDWYDGVANKAPVPKEFTGTIKSPGKFIYSKDYIFQGNSHESPLYVVPLEKHKELLMAGKITKDFGKHPGHSENFLLACLGKAKTNSPFEVSGPLSQVLHLGCIAQRLGGKLVFDRKTKQITNNKVANALLVGEAPRKGWEQYYKM